MPNLDKQISRIDMVFEDTDTKEECTLRSSDWCNNRNRRTYSEDIQQAIWRNQVDRLAIMYQELYLDMVGYMRTPTGSPIVACDAEYEYFMRLSQEGHCCDVINHIYGGSLIGTIAKRFSDNLTNQKCLNVIAYHSLKCALLIGLEWKTYISYTPLYSTLGKFRPSRLFEIMSKVKYLTETIFQTMWTPNYNMIDYKRITTTISVVNNKLIVTVEPVRVYSAVDQLVSSLLEYYKYSLNIKKDGGKQK